MCSDVVLSHSEGAVLTLTINRPDKLNALNRAVIEALDAAIDSAAGDDGVRVVVLRGAGDRAFVAGADISEFADQDAEKASEMSARGQALFRRIETLGKPVIAVIDGFALGGGLELAMACTLRIGTDAARVGQPEVNLGLIPGYGGTQRLSRLAGRAAALELCLTGEPIAADRALGLGLLNRLVPREELDETVSTLAGRLAEAAPHALRAIIECVNRGADLPLAQALEFETRQFARCFDTDDMREGVTAFLEKRKPSFKGR